MYIYKKYYLIWKEALVLAWPIVLSHIFTTAMRTTDMILMGFFGPAAVTAVGLGDVWERIVLRLGLGLGAGSIAIISQESGAENAISDKNTGEVLTQVLITGFFIGLPFMLIGLLIPDKLIAVLGATPEVIVLAAQYLLVIFLAAPFRIISLISSRALQGTGDTRTPMIVGVLSNIVNIVFSVILSLGIGPFPELGVLGVGWGTFIAKILAASAYIVVFILPDSKLNLHIPEDGWDFTITRQLLKVSIPRSLQGGYQSLIAFPFNSLILLFGTEAAAAYHISRRIQQQLMAPFQRAFGTVTTILVGNSLGKGDHNRSSELTKGILWLSLMTISIAGGFLFVFAPSIVRIFTDDLVTIGYGVRFLRVLSIGAFILTCYHVLSGLLTAAGDTRTSFYGSLINQTLFKLGLSYLLSVPLGLKLTGIFIGLLTDFSGQLTWIFLRFRSLRWIDDAQNMINERHKNKE